MTKINDTLVPAEIGVFDLSRWKPIPLLAFMEALQDLFPLESVDRSGRAEAHAMPVIQYVDEDRARVVFNTWCHMGKGEAEIVPYLMVLFTASPQFSNPVCFVRTDAEPMQA